MFTLSEKQLLEQDLRRFPVLAAAAAAIKRCSTCTHNNANPRTMLKAAILRVYHNKQFIQYLKTLTKLPVPIGGVLIEDLQ